jgi:hypothetical protein
LLAYNGNDDRHPVFSVVETDYGTAIAARRDAPNDQYYWRITPFMLPSYTIVPRAREANYIFTAAIPIDDENMMGMTVIWSPDHAITVPPVVDVDDRFRSKLNKRNDYLVDRELQRTASFTGIRGVRVQDMAVQEDQRGPISDRSTEHLGASDTGVIATRRRIIRQIRALQSGEQPTQPLQPEHYFIRSLALQAPRGVPWQELMDEYMVLQRGVSSGSA